MIIKYHISEVHLRYLLALVVMVSVCYVNIPSLAADVKVNDAEMEWQFPLPRVQTGVPLGNSVQGLLVWGRGAQLNITIARAGFWDHRGGHPFSSNATFDALKPMLLAGNADGIKDMFGVNKVVPKDEPAYFRQLGGGRLILTLPKDYSLVKALLNLETAHLKVIVRNPKGVDVVISIRQAQYEEYAEIVLPPVLAGKVKFTLRSQYSYMPKIYTETGIVAPNLFYSEKNGDTTSLGFIQTLPADSSLGVKIDKLNKSILGITTGFGAPKKLTEDGFAAGQMRTYAKEDYKQIWASTDSYWRNFWATSMKIDVPQPDLNLHFFYGLYKLASATAPHGIACGLQGPFLEDSTLAPWASDYHFNVNIQLIYAALLPTGHATHFGPLITMLQRLMPKFRGYGKGFFGVEGAILIPHAFDDLGNVSGSFWAGAIDHGTTAWVAKMCYDYTQYATDTSVLRNLVLPLLRGSLLGYRKMIVPSYIDGHLVYNLPITVSPEWKGSTMGAFGANASFQLAACRNSATLLQLTERQLGLAPTKLADSILAFLPQYATIKAPMVIEHPNYMHTRIAIWDGQDHVESYRHHSYLAGIYPFKTLNLKDTSATMQQLYKATTYNWVRKGMGAWAGWSTTWAAAIHANLGQPDQAVNLLSYWANAFTNEGYASLHDARFSGTSTAGSVEIDKSNIPRKEIMQLDATGGFISAISEIALQQDKDTISLFPYLPLKWGNFMIKNLRTNNGLAISANFYGNTIKSAKIKAETDSVKLNIKLGFNSVYTDQDSVYSHKVLNISISAGNSVILQAGNKQIPFIDFNPKPRFRRKDSFQGIQF